MDDIRILMDATYEAIKSTQKEQEKLRERCSHSVIIETNYSWRIGCVETVRMCAHCDKVMEFL